MNAKSLNTAGGAAGWAGWALAHPKILACAPYAHNHGELRTFGPPNNFGVAPPLFVLVVKEICSWLPPSLDGRKGRRRDRWQFTFSPYMIHRSRIRYLRKNKFANFDEFFEIKNKS